MLVHQLPSLPEIPRIVDNTADITSHTWKLSMRTRFRQADPLPVGMVAQTLVNYTIFSLYNYNFWKPSKNITHNLWLTCHLMFLFVNS